jgi:hypothetical protein
VFSVTRLNEERRREEPSPFEVLLISQFNRTVTTTGNMKVDVVEKPLSTESVMQKMAWDFSTPSFISLRAIC